jgi:hypothetical protein
MTKIAIRNILDRKTTKIVAAVAVAAILGLTYMSPLNIKHQSNAVIAPIPGLSGCVPIVVKEPLQVNTVGVEKLGLGAHHRNDIKSVISEKEIFQCTRTVLDSLTKSGIAFPVIREVTIVMEDLEGISLQDGNKFPPLLSVSVFSCEKQLDNMVDSGNIQVSTPLKTTCEETVPQNVLSLKTCIVPPQTTPQLTAIDAPVQMASATLQTWVGKGVVNTVIVEKEILSCDTGLGSKLTNPSSTPDINTYDHFIIEEIYENPPSKLFFTMTCQKNPSTSEVVGCAIESPQPIPSRSAGAGGDQPPPSGGEGDQPPPSGGSGSSVTQ